jgi:hypothetical protein
MLQKIYCYQYESFLNENSNCAGSAQVCAGHAHGAQVWCAGLRRSLCIDLRRNLHTTCALPCAPRAGLCTPCARTCAWIICVLEGQAGEPRQRHFFPLFSFPCRYHGGSFEFLLKRRPTVHPGALGPRDAEGEAPTRSVGQQDPQRHVRVLVFVRVCRNKEI